MKYTIKFTKKIIMWLLLLAMLGILFLVLVDKHEIPTKIEILKQETTVLPKSTLNVVEHIVTVTIYQPTIAQTDSDPDVLADGTKIKINKAGSYRYCAVSRNLLKRYGGVYQFGDMVFIDGVGKYRGWWVVKDTMNPRWTNHIDLLTDVGTKRAKFRGAMVWKFERT